MSASNDPNHQGGGDIIWDPDYKPKLPVYANKRALATDKDKVFEKEGSEFDEQVIKYRNWENMRASVNNLKDTATILAYVKAFAIMVPFLPILGPILDTVL